MAGRTKASRAVPEILLAAGIGLRVLAILFVPVASDASEYAVLGTSILAGRGMWLPWGAANQSRRKGLNLSHPPAERPPDRAQSRDRRATDPWSYFRRRSRMLMRHPG